MYRVLKDTDGTFMFVEEIYDEEGNFSGIKDTISLKSKDLKDLELKLENIAEALNHPTIYLEKGNDDD